MRKKSIAFCSCIFIWIASATSFVGVVVVISSLFERDARPSIEMETELPFAYLGTEPELVSTLTEHEVKEAYALLLVRLESIDSEAMTIRANVSYTVPSILKERLCNGFDSIYKPKSNALHSLSKRLKEEYRDQNIVIRFSERYSSTTATVSIRLEDLLLPKFGGLNDADYTTTINLPISSGQPSHFPSDWYHLDYFINNFLDGNLAMKNGNAFFAYLPTEVCIQRGDGLRSKLVKLRQIEDKPGDLAIMQIVIGSTFSKRAFVYCMSLAPIVLILLFGHFLFLYPRDGSHASTIHESVLEASGLILALLPVRSILVGSEFSEITYVDRILAAGILLVVGFVSGKYALSLHRHCRNEGEIALDAGLPDNVDESVGIDDRSRNLDKAANEIQVVVEKDGLGSPAKAGEDANELTE